MLSNKKPFAKKQKGLSGWAMMTIAIMVVIYAVVFFKLFPVYMDSWAIQGILTSLEDEPEVLNKSKDEIKTIIMKRIAMNNVSTMGRKDIKITKKSNMLTIAIVYDARVKLFGNLDGLVHVDKKLEANVE